MSEINLIHLISKLISNYEKIHGRIRFEVKMLDNTFIYTKVSKKMLALLKITQMDIVGKTYSDLPIGKDLAKKIPSIYEEAWKGKEMLHFLFPYTNEHVCLVVKIRPVIKNGKTERLVGCCAPLDVKEIKGDYMLNFDF